MRRKFFLCAAFFMLFSSFSFSEDIFSAQTVLFSRNSLFFPGKLREFSRCYPDVLFECVFDFLVWDIKCTLSIGTVSRRPASSSEARKKIVLYWADGRLLPVSARGTAEKYWSLLYSYNNVLKSPETYSAEEIERLRNFSSDRTRKNSGGTPMFFFDFLYDAESRIAIENHIVRTTFLGKPTRIHERIAPQLKRVESRILRLAENAADDAETAESVRSFIASLESAGAYHWREIHGVSRKSFHSYGIAVDLLPRRLDGKAIYWSWEKDRRGDDWMMVPLERRWSPPESVIRIFEDEGFIWGGYWAIFDNMHFEYHPELTRQK